MKLYIFKDGQILGPFTEQEVRDQLIAGRISREDMVAVEGDANWKVLGESPFARPPVFPPPLNPPPTPLPVQPQTRTYVPPTAAAIPPPYHVGSLTSHPGTSNLAIATLILGIFGVFCLLPIIPGILVGHLALRETDRIPGLQGRGLAIAGLILCYGMVILLFVAGALVVNWSDVHWGRNYTWHPGR